MTEERDRWNARFAGPEYYFGTEPNAFLAAQGARLKPGGNALAVADGEGRNGVWLARQGLAVLSLDFSEVAQEKARTLAARHGVALATEQADLATWKPGERRFDVVAAIFIQFADPMLRAHIFATIVAVLKPGGLLLLQGYRPEQLAYKTGGPAQRENLYTEALLRRSFAALDILAVTEHDSDVTEGPGHAGKSALIDLVAKKPG